MKKWFVTAACAVAVAAGTQTASAAPPAAGCPDPTSGFRLSTTAELLTVLVGPGAPAFLDKSDLNDDGLLCAKDLPDTPGNPSTARVVVDNAARTR